MYTLKNKWVFAYVYGYQRAEHYPLISVCNFNYNKLPKDALTRGVVYFNRADNAIEEGKRVLKAFSGLVSPTTFRQSSFSPALHPEKVIDLTYTSLKQLDKHTYYILDF